MSLKRSKLSNIGIWLTAITIYLSIPPVQVWNYGWIHAVLLLFVIIWGLLYGRTTNPKSILFFLLLVLLYTYLVFKAGYSFFRWPFQILLCAYVLLDTDYLHRAFNRFISIFSILLIPSLISYALFFSGLISLPELGRMDPIASSSTHELIHYPFLLISNTFQDGGFARFRAVFDEPGVVGTTAAISAVILKYDFKDWRIYPIILAGVLSFSLSFFVLFTVGLLLFSKRKINIIIISFVAIIVIYIVNTIFPDVVGELLLDRIQFDDGKLSGDNRTTKSFELWYEQFKYTKEWWFGYGNNYSQVINYGGASYKDLIVNYGILFFVLYCGGFILYALGQIKKGKEFLIYLVVFFVIMYQRPFIEMNFYFCLLLCPICALSSKLHKRIEPVCAS